MALIILGLIIIFAARFFTHNQATQRFTNPARIIGLIVVLLGILISCIVEIDVGEIGVQKLFGKIQNTVLYSGLHFINPLVDIQRMNIQTQNYTMSGVADEGAKSGDDAIKVLTADGLEVTIDLSVLYRVVPN